MRIHIFVDAENIPKGLFEKSYTYFTHRYDVVKVDIVGKERHISYYRDNYSCSSKFKFTNCFYGKNSADTFLTAYILQALFEESLTECFVILTQDRDLSVAVKFITDYNKQVILVSNIDKILSNLKDMNINMGLVSSMQFDIKKQKKESLFYFPIPEAQIKNFAYIPKTIFLRTGENRLIKVHFYDGIKYNLFLNIIPVKKIRQGYSTKLKFKDILAYSYLYIKNDMVFIDLDKILEGELYDSV